MERFFYDNIKLKLLSHIRGDQSQMAFSRELGYSFNQYHKWETGLKSLTLSDLFKVCHHKGIDLFAYFETLTLMGFRSLEPTEYVEQIFQKLGPKNKAELASILDINPSTLYRWLKGQSEPDVSLIFLWLDKRSQSLFDLMALMTSPKVAKDLLQADEVNTRRRNYASLPFTPAIQYYFATRPYLELKEHSDEKVAYDLNLSL